MTDRLKFMCTDYSKTASISITSLVNAIGKRPQYSVEREDGSRCYVNEKNAFGSGEKLKTNAILLYIYIHFLSPDQNARTRIDLFEASDYLSMPKRTLLNNLRILVRRGYICCVEGVLEGTYDILIESYSANGDTAKNGGRGYLTMTTETFAQIRTIRRINELRFAIRGLLNSVPGKQNCGLANGCPFSVLKGFFPTYTKRKDILEIMSSTKLNSLFDISLAKSMKYCAVKVRDDFDARMLKNKIVADVQPKILKRFESLNAKYPDNQFNPTASELKDICNICLREPLERVLSAIARIYYSHTRSEIKNLPAYIRTLAAI